MNKYEQLRKEIIKAVPSIKKHKNGLRPIILEDCLIAIEKAKPRYKYFVNTAGEFIVSYGYGEIEYTLDADWKMGKSLENQNEQTVEFLHNLIV